ncbi:MAG: hypothetical protein V3U80_06865 [Flavobacteriaceae bacterium]
MDLHNIEKLLDKYFDGETSVKEEASLQKYFSQKDVPAHLKEYQTMFAYFSTKKAEVSQQEIQVKTKKPWRFQWLSIAAAVVLLIAVVWNTSPKGLSPQEQKEAELAYKETIKAFQLISQNLKKGNNAIAYLDEYEVAKDKIFKIKK